MINIPLLLIKSRLWIFCGILLWSCSTSAQGLRTTSPAPTFWDDVRFGGSLGLSFGSDYFNGSLAPAAIYDFTPMFSSGISLSGAYATHRNFKSLSLGGSLIGMFRPIREIQFSTEFEQLHITRTYEREGSNNKDQYWVPALFVGVGYNAGPVVTGVRFDVLHDSEKSFYSSAFMPFVSVYF